MDGKRKLQRINEGKMLGGVCGGIAEYLDLDATIVRIGWVLLTLFVGFGILTYIIALIVMPKKM